ALFGEGVASLQISILVYTERSSSPQAYVDLYKETFGPVVSVYESFVMSPSAWRLSSGLSSTSPNGPIEAHLTAWPSTHTRTSSSSRGRIRSSRIVDASTLDRVGQRSVDGRRTAGRGQNIAKRCPYERQLLERRAGDRFWGRMRSRGVRWRRRAPGQIPGGRSRWATARCSRSAGSVLEAPRAARVARREHSLPVGSVLAGGELDARVEEDQMRPGWATRRLLLDVLEADPRAPVGRRGIQCAVLADVQEPDAVPGVARPAEWSV